ncbi:hypothetical protein [Ancylobacter mangrovi]|uniref:hypothetical protein n=1 Tax=Ancylobacter mangrovi TaxID=2972472 RepID=UPI0021624F36|nr:hypothetical protein [Ancylobacter mangrovi]MCS0503691.1 hypothetical protein [Ancylobacter mangrovi]
MAMVLKAPRSPFSDAIAARDVTWWAGRVMTDRRRIIACPTSIRASPSPPAQQGVGRPENQTAA